MDRIAPQDDIVLAEAREYIALGKQEKAIKDRRDALKARLMATVEMEGTPGEGGSEFLELSEDIEGYFTLKREHRRKNLAWDEDAIERILRDKPAPEGDTDTDNLFDACVRTVTVLDEQAVQAAHARGEISDDELDEMFPFETTYAFVPVKRPK